MADWAGLLLAAHRQRPLMEALDLLKWLYQGEFGCGHLVADPAASLLYLEAEWAAAPLNPEDMLIEPLTNGFARLNLAPARQAGLALPDVHRAFLKSAAIVCGSTAGYRAKVESLQALCREGLLPYEAAELAGLLEAWEKGGQAPFSHSAAYRARYHPAYRVMSLETLKALGIGGGL